VPPLSNLIPYPVSPQEEQSPVLDTSDSTELGVELVLTQKLMLNVLSEVGKLIEPEDGMDTYWSLEPVKLRQSPNLQLVPVCQLGELTSVPGLLSPDMSAVVVPVPSSKGQYPTIPDASEVVK